MTAKALRQVGAPAGEIEQPEHQVEVIQTLQVQGFFRRQGAVVGAAQPTGPGWYFSRGGQHQWQMCLDGGPAKGLHETGHLQAALGGRQVSGGQELHPGQSAQPLKGFLGQGQDGHVFSGGDPVAAHDPRPRANHLRLSCSAWRYAVRLSWSHQSRSSAE